MRRSKPAEAKSFIPFLDLRFPPSQGLHAGDMHAVPAIVQAASPASTCASLSRRFVEARLP